MEILSMIVVVSAIVDPWVTTLSFVVALAMRIQAKNLCLKYRFFALFRRALRRSQGALQWSLIFSSSLNDLPEKRTMSEWLCRFFSPCLSKLTQTSCAFQARVEHLARNPRARMACLARNPRTRAARGPSVRTKRARMPRNSIRALVCLDGGEGRC